QCEKTFRASLDQSRALLRKLSGLDVEDVLFKQRAPEEVSVFLITYTIAHLLGQWGIHPQVVLGNGLGEYVAACLAGVFSFEDALALIIQHVGQSSLESLRGVINRITLHVPGIPYISSVTGSWMSAEQ